MAGKSISMGGETLTASTVALEGAVVEKKGIAGAEDAKDSGGRIEEDSIDDVAGPRDKNTETVPGNENNGSPPKTPQSISKKDRKRLKKLVKRANTVQRGGERSGLLTRREVIEFKEMLASLDKD